MIRLASTRSSSRDDAPLPPATPGQMRAIAALEESAKTATIVHLVAPSGGGRSTVLRHLAQRNSAVLLTATDAMLALNDAQPAHLEEALIQLVRHAADAADMIVFDDWWQAGSFALSEPDRPFYFFQAAAALFAELERGGKTFVTAVDGANPALEAGALAARVTLPPADRSDRRAILSHHLAAPISDGVMAELERAYRGLTAHQLAALGAQLCGRIDRPVMIDDLTALLDTTTTPTNLSAGEVEAVSSRRLIGSEDAIETLERTILTPVNQPDLAASLGLHPARGVLLYGPPGTGKTTLGRLLAHRMDGRFFVIDGTMFADRVQFTQQVNQLLNRAAACSPSVVFIDDADVIFRNGQARGFVRQLLTKLDGIASEQLRSVCLVMTAMDLADIPPAIVRSGRIDVWIEMRAPDVGQRATIIADYAAAAPRPAGPFDAGSIAARCAGFTPADLRSLVAEATAAAAYDIVRHVGSRPFDDYLNDAADEITARKDLVGV